MRSNKSIKGAFRRAEGLLANNLPNREYRRKEGNRGWDDQWPNWDDFGGSDSGWGDVIG